MRVLGIDENGLGPRLGPLVATAVGFELDSYAPKVLRKLGARLGLDDSKQVSGFGQMAHAESVALAVIEAVTGDLPRCSDEALRCMSIDSDEVLQRLCPTESMHQCWQPSHSVALPAFGGAVDDGRRILDRLRLAGVRVWHGRSAIACAGMLNHKAAFGQNRLRVNLSLFERLLLEARSAATGDVYAICGMVGGIRFYPAYVQHFSREALELLSAPKGWCSYRVAGFGELHFVVDADRLHLPVALASIVGKYLRELAMARLHHFYVGHELSLPKVSGYHEPRTEQFVRRTATLRRRLGIANQCFER
jgi:ribonuclease HII